MKRYYVVRNGLFFCMVNGWVRFADKPLNYRPEAAQIIIEENPGAYAIEILQA